MTKEKLNALADELRKNVEHRLDTALLTLVEILAELDDGDIVCYSCGHIGIALTKNYIELSDIDASEGLLELQVFPDYGDIALTKKYLEAYLITNEDVLESDVIEELKRLIERYK